MTIHSIVGTAGHIDHGKSTLVQALTGTDPDRLKEEKARGITIDLGFAHWRRGDVTIAFVDVPGHERFVKNMLAGAGGIDAVLLVVAADESVMPQTREHFEICRLLGIATGAVAITKVDLVDRDTLDLVRLDIAELVRGSRLEDSPVVAVSARTGTGLPELEKVLLSLAARVGDRPRARAARLPIDRVFTMRGFGTVVTGTLVGGTVSRDDDLEVVPGGRRVKVRGAQVHGESRDRAEAGERVALNLAGVDVSQLTRGQVLAAPGTLAAWNLLDAALEIIPGARPLSQGARVRFHQGTTEVLARVSMVGPSGESGRVPSIAPGERGFVRLHLDSAAAVTRGDRFVLRSYSPAVTIGGGWVLDPAAPRSGVRAQSTLDRLERLARPFIAGASGDALEALEVFVLDAGPRGFTPQALLTRCGLGPEEADASLAALVAEGRAERIGPELLVGPGWRPTLARRVLEALEAHHGAEPLSEGLPREELRERVLAGVHPAVADSVLDDLERRGQLTGRDRVALAGRGPSLSPEEARAAAAIERACLEAGLAPPEPAVLAATLGLPTALVDRVSALLVRQKVLLRVGGPLFHREVLARLKGEIASLKSARGADTRVDVGTFKQRFGLTRKYAIPLLEYLDRERVTRRVGDTRVVL